MGTGAQTEAVNQYRDRSHAGDVLAAELARRDLTQPTVLGLVRGGVPVAVRVAAALHAPLDALVVRKLGVPWAPEVAFGALGPAGVRVLNPQVADQVSRDDIAEVTEQEKAELARREDRYRPGRGPVEVGGRTAVVVDDGLATGATARAAVEVVRKLGADRVVLAVPVGSPQAVDWLREAADEVVCPLAPADFGAVSRYFETFEQVTDGAVVALLGATG
ncbi:MAG: phosphoribosyltransferase [Micromonosporaceae bacterium]|nr:phosphoribosyltransferase [Micromonosporaceae bacterium]